LVWRRRLVAFPQRFAYWQRTALPPR
jgi:hypothetical protein